MVAGSSPARGANKIKQIAGLERNQTRRKLARDNFRTTVVARATCRCFRGFPRSDGANIRSVSSLHWRGWLGKRNRCLVPATSIWTKPHKTPAWFALFAFAGLWASWRGVRGHEPERRMPTEWRFLHDAVARPPQIPQDLLGPRLCPARGSCAAGFARPRRGR
jgi:hypothetical protein